jgi:hypothetical protein
VIETPKQRRERLEVERANERHAALERRLQEAAERRTQLLHATRTAATLTLATRVAAEPEPPVSTAFNDSSSNTTNIAGKYSENGQTRPQGAASAAGASGNPRTSHVQRETWAGRVLRSRGVQFSEHAKSSALYNQILKGLRTKASKLRKRLVVETCIDDEELQSIMSRTCSSELGNVRAEPGTSGAACSSESSFQQHCSNVVQVCLLLCKLLTRKQYRHLLG